MDRATYVLAALLIGGLVWLLLAPPDWLAPVADRLDTIWGAVSLLSVLLTSLLLVARWYMRLGNNSDIAALQQSAFAYRLGGSIALRPFLGPSGPPLHADSPLMDYRQAVIEPEFLRVASLPPFLLAWFCASSLALLTFCSGVLELASYPHLLLSGPMVADQPLLDTRSGILNDVVINGVTGQSDPKRTLVLYQSGATLCIAFAFLGALVWSLTYLARRMALRDVTGHAFQTITVRLIVSAVVALFLYHLQTLLVGPASEFKIGSAVIMLIAFGAGVVPEIALRWLSMQARWLFGDKSKNKSDDLELETIEGIDAYTRVRLAEAGINDAQGLLAANPLHLTLRTPFTLPQIIDWLGQAYLLVQLKPERYAKCRDKGLRTAWQLDALVDIAPERPAQLAEPEPPAFEHRDRLPAPVEQREGGAAPMTIGEARILHRLLTAEPSFERAREIARRLRDPRQVT